MKKLTLTVLATVIGLLLSAPLSASATDNTCVPTDAIPAYTEVVPDITHPAVGEPTIEVTNPDYVPAVEASTKWWNFSPNKGQGPFDGPPTFPSDDRGTWQGPHTNGGPGQDQTGVYQQGNGHGSWFYRENTPGTPAQGEATIVVANPDYVPEWIEVVPDIEHSKVPAVACPPTSVGPDPDHEGEPVIVVPEPEADVVTPQPARVQNVAVEELAETGSEDLLAFIILGGVMLALGVGTTVISRRREVD